MTSISSAAPSWRKMQIPRPLQRLFDHFPLQTYEANELPERSQHLTSSDLPTLYVFSTDSDARLGLPSFNPGCLKWQTLLRLANIDFRILPSTNHSSPTGSLPFLLPPRTSSTTSPAPVPASSLLSFARRHRSQQQQQQAQQQQDKNFADLDHLDDADLPPRAQAYLSLITHSLRNAWLYALYLDPARAALLRYLYIDPASSSHAVRAALLYQLRHAAAEQIATTSPGSGLGSGADGVDGVDEEAVYRSAGQALDALASLLRESGTAWFFGAERPGPFDVALFSYTHLMVEYMSEDEDGNRDGSGEKKGQRVPLGRMVKEAGNGELARHRESMLGVAWPEWEGYRR